MGTGIKTHQASPRLAPKFIELQTHITQEHQVWRNVRDQPPSIYRGQELQLLLDLNTDNTPNPTRTMLQQNYNGNGAEFTKI